MGKNLLAVQETQVWSLGWEDPLEKEMATFSSMIAWKIPWTEENWWATVHGVTVGQTWLSDWACTHTHTHTHTHFCIYRGEKPTAVNTATHGQKNPVGMTSEVPTLAFLDPASLAPFLTLASDSFQNKWDSTASRLQGKEERGHLFF